MNVIDLLQNTKASGLFKTFLKIGHKTTRSGALVNVECYELCEKLQLNETSRTEEAYDELKELCPSYKWEERLDEAIQSDSDGNSTALKEYFTKLMFEARCQIEVHPDYERFRKELARKLGS